MDIRLPVVPGAEHRDNGLEHPEVHHTEDRKVIQDPSLGLVQNNNQPAVDQVVTHMAVALAGLFEHHNLQVAEPHIHPAEVEVTQAAEDMLKVVEHNHLLVEVVEQSEVDIDAEIAARVHNRSAQMVVTVAVVVDDIQDREPAETAVEEGYWGELPAGSCRDLMEVVLLVSVDLEGLH